MEYKISVVIPKIRQDAPVCRTINNMLRQTFQNFEIIVADVHFNYEEILFKYTGNNKNISVCKTISDAIAVSSGEYILFMRDNSVLAFSALQQFVDSVEMNNFDIVACKCAEKNETGDFIEVKREFLEDEQPELRLIALVDIYMCIFKKELLCLSVKNINFDVIGNELEILIKCAINAGSIEFLPNILVYSSKCSIDDKSDNYVVENLQALCKLTNFLIENELFFINYRLFLDYIKPIISDFETDKYSDAKNIFIWLRHYFMIIIRNDDIRRFISTVLPRREKFILETNTDLFLYKKPSELYSLTLKADAVDGYLSALLESHDKELNRQDEFLKKFEDNNKDLSDRLIQIQDNLISVNEKIDKIINNDQPEGTLNEMNPAQFFLEKCRNGHIGMRTIIKGIFGWLKFKFKRGKKK